MVILLAAPSEDPVVIWALKLPKAQASTVINTTVKFNILQNGGFINPNIRVSLYKKNKLTAFDQTYTIVDLKDYVTNSLEKVSDNIYYAIKSPLFYNGQASTYNAFNLNFINTNFENNGYKLVFELYSGSVKIATIEKKFIVK